MGLAIAGIAGSAAGSALGNAVGGGNSSAPQLTTSTPNFVKQMNQMLGTALNNAIGTSTNYTNQAVAQQNQSLQQATDALNTGLTNATSTATQNAQQGFNISQALQSPYNTAGNSALDAYMDSLGIPRVAMGSNAYQKALTATANNQQLLSQLQQQQQAYNGMFSQYKDLAPTNGMFTPDSPTTTTQDQSLVSSGQMTQAQVDQAYRNRLAAYQGLQSTMQQVQGLVTPQQLAVASAANKGLFGGNK